MTTAPSARPGRIVTLYSYKGGTGRSMALANLAWVLAANRKRVLMMDWDLEAPGLHRYFHPFLLDPELARSNGLVDLLADYADRAIQTAAEPREDWQRDYADLSSYVLGVDFDGFPAGGRIDLLPAGRQGPGYASKLDAFDWATFYDRLGGGAYLEAIKEWLRREYDYILVDSRTGVSDTAGICTVQMPDVLAVFFTYNNQSLRGALAVARSAVETRRERFGQFSREPFRVLPVPSRADPFEQAKLQRRQAYAQQLWKPLLAHLPEQTLAEYWSGVEVPYSPYLNYEEVLSPLVFPPEDSKLPLASVLKLAAYATDGEVTRYDLTLAPGRREQLLAAYAEVDLPDARRAPAESEDDRTLRLTEAALSACGEVEVASAKRLFLRLVGLPQGQETVAIKRLWAPLDALSEAEQALVDRFVQAGALRLSRAAPRSAASGPAASGPAASGSVASKASQGATIVDIGADVLLTRWRALADWIAQERAFLEARAWLQPAAEQWTNHGRSQSLLLAEPLAAQAVQLLQTHAAWLDEDERAYIEASREHLARLDAAARVALMPAAQSGASPQPPAAAPGPAAKAPALWRGALAVGVLVPALIGGLAWFGLDSPPAPVTDPQTPAQDVGAEPQPAPPAVPPQSSYAGEVVAQSLVAEGRGLLEAGQAEAAIQKYDAALQISAATPDALRGRAEANLALKRTDAAVADLQTILHAHPEDGVAAFELAQIFARDRAHRREAAALYRQVLLLDVPEELRKTATAALERIDPARGRPRVSVTVNRSADRAFAQRLLERLAESGYLPQGVQVLKQSGNADVRYYFVEDEAVARKIQALTGESLNQAGYRLDVALIYLGSKGSKFGDVRRGTVEVWLPALAPPGKAAQ